MLVLGKEVKVIYQKYTSCFLQLTAAETYIIRLDQSFEFVKFPILQANRKTGEPIYIQT